MPPITSGGVVFTYFELMKLRDVPNEDEFYYQMWGTLGGQFFCYPVLTHGQLPTQEQLDEFVREVEKRSNTSVPTLPRGAVIRHKGNGEEYRIIGDCWSALHKEWFVAYVKCKSEGREVKVFGRRPKRISERFDAVSAFGAFSSQRWLVNKSTNADNLWAFPFCRALRHGNNIKHLQVCNTTRGYMFAYELADEDSLTLDPVPSIADLQEFLYTEIPKKQQEAEPLIGQVNTFGSSAIFQRLPDVWSLPDREWFALIVGSCIVNTQSSRFRLIRKDDIVELY